MIDAAQDLRAKLVSLARDATTVVTGGRLIDGTGGPPVDNATVVIRGDRIAAVGPAARVPVPQDPSVRTIDARGKTVLPGLIDSHVHFTGDTGRSALERYIPANEAYKAIVAAQDALNALRAGFTTMRVLGHGSADIVYALRKAVAEGRWPGPRLLTAGWAISQSGGHGDPHLLPHDLVVRFRPRSAFADGAEECRRLVRLNFGDGADLVKIYTSEGSLVGDRNVVRYHTNFTLEEIRVMSTEAHARGAKVAAHATHPEGVRLAIEGGVDTIEHGGDLSEDADTLKLMVDRGTFLIPTLDIFYFLVTEGAAWGVKPFGIETARQTLEAQRRYLKRALDMGVKIALGTDCGLFGHGSSARELAHFVSCGFSPMEALVAGTRTAAAALGLEQDLGTLTVGKIGELLVTDADPLADIASLQRSENIRWILKTTAQLT
jgi:imidazolonepropionase-like amidohydrolase